MNKAEFFWTLQRISQEKRNGNLYVNSSNFLCNEGVFVCYHPALLDEVLKIEDFEMVFERSAQQVEEFDDFANSISPGNLMLDLVEAGFNLLDDEVDYSPATQAVEFLDNESANESVDKALLEAMQDKDLGSAIGVASVSDSEQDNISQNSFLGSIEPMTSNHKVGGLAGQIQSFNYTCLIPKVSRGLVTIIGFGFIAFSAFIVPRLFSGLFKAIADVVILP